MSSHSHSHHTHPTSSHDNNNTITSANRTFFNDLASKYDIKPWQQKVSFQITTFIQSNLDFIGLPNHHHHHHHHHPIITCLDYACGTGMISRALGPYVDSIQAIDLSPAMVKRYNELAGESEISAVREAWAVEGNLFEGGEDHDHDYQSSTVASSSSSEVDLDGAKYRDFSIVAVGLGAHHFADPKSAIGRLVQRLKVGGVLLIFDFVEPGKGEEEEEQEWVSSGADKTIHKRGFTEVEMRGIMEGCGLGEFGWKVLPERTEIRMIEEKPFYRLGFLARGVKMA